ncbi:MAG: hypothetical protein CME06_13300, partial [Gemmatimonadetes bacterium]|nr:hypothetical protein [Gemmatimonadota bacterium]
MTHPTHRLLARHRRSLRARTLARTALRIIAFLPWALAIAVPLAVLSTLVMRIWVGTYTAAALYRLIADASRVPPLHPLAHRLDTTHADLQGLLSPGLELEEGRSPIEESSPELRAELLRRATEMTRRWKPPAPPVPIWPHARIALAGIIALGLIAAAFPGSFLAAPSALLISKPEGPRLLKLRVRAGMTSDFGIPSAPHLRHIRAPKSLVNPTRTPSATPPELLEGETAQIRVIALGAAAPDTVELGVRITGEEDATTRWRPLPRAKHNLFATALPLLRRDLVLTARAPGFSADSVHMSVRERPRVERITVTSTPPEHTGLPSASSDGDLVVPSGSAITVEGSSNVPLLGASIAFGAKDSIACRVDGASFQTVWTASRDTTWRVILSDARGTPPSLPRLHGIRVLPDHAPVVELRDPSTDIDLDEGMSVRLAWHAIDDYGLSALELRYEIEEGRGGSLALRRGELGEETEGGIDWSLDPLDLLPGDSVEFWIRARDNDAVDGPKWGESEHRRARFPTIVEIYAEVAGHGEEGTRAARELSDAFEEMGERLREIREAAADAGGHLSWDAEKELESMQARGEELRGAIESMEEHLEEEAGARAGEMAEAVARKLDEVHRLMDEVLDEDLRELMKELGRAIAAADPDELDPSLERAQLLDEEILRNLERTAAILERLRQEKALEEAIAMAAELAEREARIAEMVQEGENEPAASAQERAPGDMEALEERIGEAARSGIDEDLASELEEAAEAGLGPVPRARAGRIPRDLRAGRIGRARSDLSELRGVLESLHSRLLGLQEMHIERMKGDLDRRMQALFKRLAEISRRAERHGPRTGADAEEGAVLQSRLARNLRGAIADLESLERESLFVTPDLRGRLMLAADALESSSRELAEGHAKPAGNETRRAMAQLNKAGAKLLDGMQALRNAASSTGYPEAMQQLAAAAEAQAQLLGQGEETLPIPRGPAPGPGERASLARMASEQARIRELVAQARRALGEEGGGVGDLRAIEERMKEVEDALRAGAPSESILRQERTILNRLLEAERSVRKQGSSKRRESRVAEKYRWSPDAGV